MPYKGKDAPSHLLASLLPCPIYSSWLSSAAINTVTKSNFGRKGFIPSYSLRFITKGNQSTRRNAAAGLPPLPQLAEPACFIQPNTARPGMAPLSGLGFPTSIINQENVGPEKRFIS